MLELNNYPSKFSTAPLASACAWISYLSLDLGTGAGRIVVNVNTDAEAANALLAPVDQVGVALGQDYGDTQFVTLPEAMSDPDFAAAWGTVRLKLYEWLVQRVPAFQGATAA